MNITVYCGSKFGNSKDFETTSVDLGKEIADHGHALVFGASDTGLMGAVLRGCRDNGGDVIGVTVDIPFIREKASQGLTKLIESKDLSERKKTMMDLGDAFVALPGGLGTLDEITDIIEISYLGEVKKPVVFMNTNGFYQDLKNMFDRMDKEGFMQFDLSFICFAADAKEAVEFIESHT